MTTKLAAILKGCKLVDKMFGFREKEIRRKLEAAKDKCEVKKLEAQMDYEKALKRLGEDNVNYESVLNDKIKAKQGIYEAEDTLKVIEEIEKDLDSEAELEPEEDKK